MDVEVSVCLKVPLFIFCIIQQEAVLYNEKPEEVLQTKDVTEKTSVSSVIIIIYYIAKQFFAYKNTTVVFDKVV